MSFDPDEFKGLMLLLEFRDSLEEQDRTNLSKLIEWARPIANEREARVKVVLLHNGQPDREPDGNYDGPQIMFSRLTNTGEGEKSAWFARIPLKKPLSVTLSVRDKPDELPDTEIAYGGPRANRSITEKRNYRPRVLQSFLRNPGHYTKLRVKSADGRELA
jgi:hypothetical protein